MKAVEAMTNKLKFPEYFLCLLVFSFVISFAVPKIEK